jgi:hypothetical protein
LRVKYILLFSLFFLITNLNAIDIYKNYVQVYGEGPNGQQIFGFESRFFSKEETVEFARNEIMEFLSGLLYGYNFNYKIENQINKTKGYFELKNISKIKKEDKNLSLTQVEESQLSKKIQAIYRLNENQKNYIAGFHSSLSKSSSGEGSVPVSEPWEKRLEAYKDSLKNSILNNARKTYKSRPLYIQGKVFLSESPKFSLVSGEWKVDVKTQILITKVEYLDNY